MAVRLTASLSPYRYAGWLKEPSSAKSARPKGGWPLAKSLTMLSFDESWLGDLEILELPPPESLDEIEYETYYPFLKPGRMTKETENAIIHSATWAAAVPEHPTMLSLDCKNYRYKSSNDMFDDEDEDEDGRMWIKPQTEVAGFAPLFRALGLLGLTQLGLKSFQLGKADLLCIVNHMQSVEVSLLFRVGG